MPIDENFDQASIDNSVANSEIQKQNSQTYENRDQSPSQVQIASPLKVIKEVKPARINIDKKRIHPVEGYSDFENMW